MKVSVKTYADLARWAKSFAQNKHNLLLLVGDPGLQKSTIFREYAEGARWIEGSASAFRLYCDLFLNQNKPYVIDDVDQLFNDKSATRLLKCVCQTDDEKKVAWHTAARQLDELGVPREFTTRSKVAIIANKFDPDDRNMAAIVDRGIYIDFRPTAHEVHERVKKQGWFNDAEIFRFIEKHLDLIQRPSMRFYVTAKAIKDAKQNWKLALLETWGLDDRAKVVIELSGDNHLSSPERVKLFIERTGASRPTYFRLRKMLGLTRT